MKSEITDLLSELLISSDKELINRLRKEQEQLNKVKCTDKKIGNWIDDHELPVLLELLDSPDTYFYKHFPKIAPFSLAQRREFAEQIQKHIKVCEHCILKISYDTNWEMQVNSVTEQHRETLIKTISQKEKMAKPASGGRVRTTGA